MNAGDLHAGLDTSVVLRLLVGQLADQYAAAIEFLDGVEKAGGRVLVSNLVIAEAYFACQHHYGLTKADVIAGLCSLLRGSLWGGFAGNWGRFAPNGN